MNERDLIKLYKKRIEVFLSALNMYKSKTIANIDENIKEKNVKFIKEKMMDIYADNFNEKLFNQAINELYPYLKEF